MIYVITLITALTSAFLAVCLGAGPLKCTNRLLAIFGDHAPHTNYRFLVRIRPLVVPPIPVDYEFNPFNHR